MGWSARANEWAHEWALQAWRRTGRMEGALVVAPGLLLASLSTIRRGACRRAPVGPARAVTQSVLLWLSEGRNAKMMHADVRDGRMSVNPYSAGHTYA